MNVDARYRKIGAATYAYVQSESLVLGTGRYK